MLYKELLWFLRVPKYIFKLARGSSECKRLGNIAQLEYIDSKCSVGDSVSAGGSLRCACTATVGLEFKHR